MGKIFAIMEINNYMVDFESGGQKEVKLPSMPEAVRECLSQMYSAEANIGKLYLMIQKDAGITSSVLKLANSSIYAMGHPTSDLNIAMTRIGLSALMQILIKYSIENAFLFEPIEFFDVKSFSKHSSWVYQIAVEIGKILNVEKFSDLLVAGLMHDVGLLVRAVLDRPLMQRLTEVCLAEKKDFNLVEKELKLGSHQLFGATILEKWQFPKEVVLLTKYHHTLENFRPKNFTIHQNKLINILMLSDTVAHRYGDAFQQYPRETRVNPQDLEILGIQSQDLANAIKQATQQLQFF
ncbi:MAG: HDOD domain-containing protein [Spirobacillus cienkowskii]|uniref:HDOD domain-containing protein n=1 Tax=Spirobacillus cienkowskii TaxID=495820 RepID=A0A369KSS1_9BACT|nr:MAG: HDOD domain-containing protein [Spirobacillus cienkowskii]